MLTINTENTECDFGFNSTISDGTYGTKNKTYSCKGIDAYYEMMDLSRLKVMRMVKFTSCR